VVVPERAHRFIDVPTLGLEIRENSGQHVGIVLIIEMAYLEEIAREAVAFRRRVSVMQMRGDGGKSKTTVPVHGGQRIVVPHQDRYPIVIDIGGAGAGDVTVGVIEAPYGLNGKIRRLADLYHVLNDVVQLLGREEG